MLITGVNHEKLALALYGRVGRVGRELRQLTRLDGRLPAREDLLPHSTKEVTRTIQKIQTRNTLSRRGFSV